MTITFTEDNKGVLAIRKNGTHIGALYMASRNGPSVSLNTSGTQTLTQEEFEIIGDKLKGFRKWYDYFYG